MILIIISLLLYLVRSINNVLEFDDEIFT